MAKTKMEFSLHVAVSADIADALDRAASETVETVSQITRRALVRELRRTGFLPDPSNNQSQQIGVAA